MSSASSKRMRRGATGCPLPAHPGRGWSSPPSPLPISRSWIQSIGSLNALPGWHIVESLIEGGEDEAGSETGTTGVYRTLVPFIKGSLVVVVKGMTLRYYGDYTDMVSDELGHTTGHFRLSSAFRKKNTIGGVYQIAPSDIECRYSALGPRVSAGTTVG